MVGGEGGSGRGRGGEKGSEQMVGKGKERGSGRGREERKWSGEDTRLIT